MATSTIDFLSHARVYTETSYSNQALADILASLKNKYYVNGATVVVFFTINNCTGMPTLTSGVCAAFLNPLSSGVEVVAAWENNIEAAKIVPTA